MRTKGINYDTGYIYNGKSSRETFDMRQVSRELEIIRDNLHCNAVRVTGGDPERIESAASIAARLGLEVWFSPFTCDLTHKEMLDMIADCALRAERLRQTGAKVVLVIGAEISVLNKGFMPGDTLVERLELLKDRQRLRPLLGELPAKVNNFLSGAVKVGHKHFGGQVTYAAMPLERVDWQPFDIISVDNYRTAEVADHFKAGMKALVAQGKPVAITEFGSTTFRGAADRGAQGGDVVVWDVDTGKPLRLDGEYVRDEAEQATYLRELLDIFDNAGVDSTFVFTFAQYAHFQRNDPHTDLDMGSYGIVKMLEDQTGHTYEDMPWEPKMAFKVVSDFYNS